MTGLRPDGPPPGAARVPDTPADLVAPGAPTHPLVPADPDTPADLVAPGIDSGPPPGPPGGGMFTLEGRRAPGLYLVAWILSVVGLVLTLVIGPMASAEGARLLLVVAGAVLLTLGLATACGYQVLERRGRPADRYHGPSPLLVFLTYLLSVSVMALVATAIFHVPDGVFDDPDPPAFLLVGSLQALAYVVLVWLFVIRTGSLTWPHMGWPTWQGNGPRAVLRAIGEAMAIMLPTTFVMATAGAVLALILGVEAPSVIPVAETSAEALAIVFAAVLIIPIGEELFFRGFALTAWLQDLGPRSALVRSALFFALVHLNNIRTGSFLEGSAQFLLQTAVLLPVGFVLGWLFLRRGMAAAIAGHVTYNGLLLFLSLLASTLPRST